MTSTVPRRRDADFADLIGQLNRLCDEQKAQAAADRLDARVQRAIQERACRILRAYETASTAHHHRHTMTGIPTPPHEVSTILAAVRDLTPIDVLPRKTTR